MVIKAKFQDKYHQWKNNWQLSSIWPEIGIGADSLIWKGEIKGNLTTSSAINLVRNKEQSLHCHKYIWNSYLHPAIASNIWKIVQGAYVDDSVLIERKYDLDSRCCICEEEHDNMHHLLWECKFSKEIWKWICSIFQLKVPNSLEVVWSNAKGKSPFFKECWIIAACATLKELWFQKNKMLFEQVKPNIQSFKSRIKKAVYEGGFRIKSNMWNNDNDNQVILFFNLGARKIKFQHIKPCFWIPPSAGYVMFCCDGASIGNPGAAGFGVVIRDHLSQVLGDIIGGFGIATNYIAEVYEIIGAVELAVDWKLQNIILNSDSKTVISEFAEIRCHGL
ncbi:uncharacterized protein LOC113343014 [Papaver somniferum]|uniref:uncharacterized protein LOC113343014 n=1 Tax=Papaver somniferum TaxID=3469 RepID=UPI000E70486D|nr:uncharacterized protein LOC113343014 [Papaver somniferum]